MKLIMPLKFIRLSILVNKNQKCFARDMAAVLEGIAITLKKGYHSH
jgi:hypothetical protein